MVKNAKDQLELVYDLIKLAKRSKMAFRYLEDEVEVIPMENVGRDPQCQTESFTFHPNGECGCIALCDDYIFGIRCDHLIWFEGECEYPDCKAIIVCGNHKGNYKQKLIVFHEK